MWTLLATAAKSSRTRAGGGSTRRTSKLAPGTALLYSFSCHAQWKDGSSKRSITCFCEWTARISQATKLQWLSPLVSPSESGHANGSQARHSERAEKNKKRSTNKRPEVGVCYTYNFGGNLFVNQRLIDCLRGAIRSRADDGAVTVSEWSWFVTP